MADGAASTGGFRHFHSELATLKQRLLEMSERAESLVDLAVEALVERDREKAVAVIEADHELDRLEVEAENLAISLLALQQPDGHLDLPPHQTALGDGLRCCMQEAAVLGPGTGRWPGLDAWYLPLGTPGAMSGAACVQNVAAADHAGRAHAQGICALLAQTLWRLRLAASMLAAQIESDRQQIQSTFLAAISHDLRTPLAALMGAASSLQTQRDRLSARPSRIGCWPAWWVRRITFPR